MRPVVNAWREASPAEVWKDEYLHVAPGAYVMQAQDKIIVPLLIASSLLLLVLATACANLGNLLLARSVSRERELAIRTAVGANRGRIVRQLMTESAALALLGAGAGLALSMVATTVLVRLLDWPSLVDATPDWRVVGFALGSGLLASVFFGLAPALQATRTDAKRAARLRLTLVGLQAAASCILLIVSGLLLRGLSKAVSQEPGFAYAQSAVVDPDLHGVGREGAAARLYFNELQSRLARVSGVEATAIATVPPLGRRTISMRNAAGTILVNHISPDYFVTMQIPLLRGRNFHAGDREVTILGERTASRMWPNQDPIGKEFVASPGEARWTVVGVAANAPITLPGDSDAMELYRPIEDANLREAMLLVRTARWGGVQGLVQQAANGVDPLVIPKVTSMREGMERQMRNSRSGALTVAFLGIVSLTLAVVGFAGLISFSVTQRTREIGIRLALGATRWEVMRVGLDRLLVPTVCGLIVGAAAAAGMADLLRSQLYGLSPLDPVSFLGAPLLFLVVALVFSVGPLSRAARVDPSTALRHD
jgi:predicted permease